MQELIASSKIINLITPAAGAAGTTEINSSVIDFGEAEGALIIVSTGPIVSGAVTSFKFQGGATNSPTTDIAGTSQTIADDADNTVFYLDVRRPQLKYGRIVVSRSTQNATLTAVAVLYGHRDLPLTQPAGVTGRVLSSPAAGTP